MHSTQMPQQLNNFGDRNDARNVAEKKRKKNI